MNIQVNGSLESTPLLAASSHLSENKNQKSQKKISLHRRINLCVQGVNLILLAYTGMTAHKKFHAGEDIKGSISSVISVINTCAIFLSRHHFSKFERSLAPNHIRTTCEKIVFGHY